MKTIKSLGKYIGSITFINGIKCDKPYNPNTIKYGLADIKVFVDSLIEDRDIHNQQAKRRSDAQAKDNAALINKITILNSDIKDYERSTKHIIEENNGLVKDKNKHELRYATVSSQRDRFKFLFLISIVFVIGLSIISIITASHNTKVQNQYHLEHDVLVDSLDAQYIDTLWTCRNAITKQSNALIAAEKRTEYVIMYYNSSDPERIEMEEDLGAIIMRTEEGDFKIEGLDDAEEDM